PGLLDAALEVDDALDVDNRAYAWVRAGRNINLLLVSPRSSLTDDILAISRSVPGLGIRSVTPDDYRPEETAPFDAVIFHRFAPPPPAVSALYIYPPVGNSVFPIVAQTGDVEVIDWNDRHEILQRLRPLPPWPLAAAQIIQLPAGSEPLLWSRNGEREFPLAFA